MMVSIPPSAPRVPPPPVFLLLLHYYYNLLSSRFFLLSTLLRLGSVCAWFWGLVWSGWSAWFGSLLSFLVACTGLVWLACLLLGCLGFCARLVLQLRKNWLCFFAQAKCRPSPAERERERERESNIRSFFITATRNTPVLLVIFIYTFF